MTPGHPTADLIFEKIIAATSFAHAIVTDHDERELRAALAALSVFRGPGTVARDICITIIRDELLHRGAAR